MAGVVPADPGGILNGTGGIRFRIHIGDGYQDRDTSALSPKSQGEGKINRGVVGGDVIKLSHPIIRRKAPAIASMSVVDDGIPNCDGGIDGRPVVANDEGIGFLTRAIGYGPGGKAREFLDREGRRCIGLGIENEASPVIDDLAGIGGCGRGIVGCVPLHLARLGVVHGHQPLVGHAGKNNIVDRGAGEIMGDGGWGVIWRIPGVARAVRRGGGGAGSVVVHDVARVGIGKISVVSVGAGDVDHPGGHDDAVLEVDVFHGDDVGDRVDVTHGDGNDGQGPGGRVDKGNGCGSDQVPVDPNIHFVVRRSVKRGRRRSALGPKLIHGNDDLPN